MRGLTVITPTGGRPGAFALCELFMARQTYRDPYRWVVVDDCDPVTVCTMGQVIIRPEPRWKPGQNTLARNLLAALDHVDGSGVVFAEDDDYLGPEYLETMAAMLDAGYPIVGDGPTRYYSVQSGHYRNFGTQAHASLGQTGIAREALGHLRSICEQGGDFIDIRLWRQLGRRGVIQQTGNVVGIKGLPGRPGIGIGHRPRPNWPHDRNGSVLRSWIGEDAALYERYARKVAA